MNSIQRRAAIFLAGALAAGSVLAPPAAPVRVGSKIDTEGKLLGNMIVLVLEANGIKTENKASLGTTKVVRGAITAGEIDIYPEYTGNGSFMFSEESSPVWKSWCWSRCCRAPNSAPCWPACKTVSGCAGC